MKDNMDDRLDQLFAAARAEHGTISGADEYFETRLMARLQGQREMSGPWYAAAWRMLPAFAVIAVIITLCTFTLNLSKSTDMFAAITNGQDEIVAMSYLSGE